RTAVAAPAPGARAAAAVARPGRATPWQRRGRRARRRRPGAASCLPLDALPDRRPNDAGDVLTSDHQPLVLQLTPQQLVELGTPIGQSRWRTVEGRGGWWRFTGAPTSTTSTTSTILTVPPRPSPPSNFSISAPVNLPQPPIGKTHVRTSVTVATPMPSSALKTKSKP